MRPEAVPWSRFADEDLRMARLAFREGMPNQACFHAQQCCEKMLKAVLVSGDVDVPRTHKMADLLSLLRQPLHADLGERVLLLE